MRILPVFLWITSCAAATLYLILALVGGLPETPVYALLMAIVYAELYRVARKLENARLWSVLLYPLPLILFLLVFFWSLAKKILGLNVKWKGRSIRLEK